MAVRAAHLVLSGPVQLEFEPIKPSVNFKLFCPGYGL